MPMRRRHLLLAMSAALHAAACDAAASAASATSAASAASASADEPIESPLTIGSTTLTLIIEPGFDPAQLAALHAWARRAAEVVAAYLGRFPLQQVELQLQRVPGSGVLGGSTFAEPEPYVRVRVGALTQASHLAGDWVLVHEMVHLAVPRVLRRHNWFHEGVATYVESVARARYGVDSAHSADNPARLWGQFVLALPQGQPQAGDRGLDHTPTWGRTYWGGALFCLLADVQLLQRSELRQGLREALQALLAAGGHYGVAWPLERVLRTCDQALGQHTLLPLYESMRDSAEPG
jgi:hypothetical protein